MVKEKGGNGEVAGVKSLGIHALKRKAECRGARADTGVGDGQSLCKFSSDCFCFPLFIMFAAGS